MKLGCFYFVWLSSTVFRRPVGSLGLGELGKARGSAWSMALGRRWG